MNFFEIERVEAVNSDSRNTRGEISHIRFHPLEDAERPDMALETLVQHLLDRVLQGHPPALKIGLQVHPPSFHNPFTIPLRPPEQNNAAALAAAIERLNEQSEAGIDLLSGTTVCKVIAVWPLQSNNNRGACSLDIEHKSSIKCQSLVRINNPTDRLCLGRAIYIGLLYILSIIRDRPRGWFKTVCGEQHLHLDQVRELLQDAGIPLDLQFYGLEHIASIQRLLNERVRGAGGIRIVVFSKENQYRIIYKGEGRAAKFDLCLLLEQQHFSYLGRPEQLFKAQRYCIDCERTATRYRHWAGCKIYCRYCMRSGPEYPCKTQLLQNGQNSSIKCQECRMIFPNQLCYDYHLVNQAPADIFDRQRMRDGRANRPFRTVCQMRRQCPECLFIIFDGQNHTCRNLQQQQQQQQQAQNDPPICPTCWGKHEREQPCFIQPITGNDNQTWRPPELQQQQQQQPIRRGVNRVRPIRLCFFDAETSQNEAIIIGNGDQPNAYKHRALLIIAEIICENCIRDGIDFNEIPARRAQDCFCGRPVGDRGRRWCSPPFRNAANDNTPKPTMNVNPRRFFFHSFDDENVNPAEEFLDYLTRTGPKNVKTICIAHNGGKFDFHLILEALHHRNQPPKRLCTTGLKIYSISLGGQHQRNVVFKDSINYFFCPLDDLVKTFDLPATQATCKPFFPYMFVRRENLHQRLHGLPPMDDYQPQYMKAGKREAFLQWYPQNEAIVKFQLREQLLLYCANDVAILRESIVRFRKLIADHTQGLDPFQIASTGAGIALATMRRCFLPPNWLVHSPEGGYLRGRRASAESLRYIKVFEKLKNAEGQIQCANWSIGEANVEDTGYRLDGLWYRAPPLRPLAIEFMGCYYHGCRECFPERDRKLAGGKTAEQLFERTQQRLYELENVHNFALHVFWGHELKKKLRKDGRFREEWLCMDVNTRPLDPREDALRGGRTEPFKLFHECKEDEEIIYIDIVSLYPAVMKMREFPVGNPTILTQERLDRETPTPWTFPEQNVYKGLFLVRVLPPSNGLRYPLLPYRTRDGRLTFPLCALCADRKQQNACRHNDQQRAWKTAYTHVELNKALQLGYKVINVFEIWHYEKWDRDLFSGYVNTFVGVKQQASGWPAGCDTPEERQAYMDAFELAEGIRLIYEMVEKNPGLRLIAKLLLNALWGKFAQRVAFTEVRYTKTPEEFHQLLADDTLECLDFKHVSEEMDMCIVRKRPEFAKPPSTNCLPIAIFVTSYARLHLYSYMEKVQQIGAELLYCDTDSIQYVAKRDGARVEEGENLGQMKREHPGRRIVEGIYAGPKNYGFVHVDRQTGGDRRAELKIRSFPLSYSATQLLNFESVKQLALEHFNIDGELDDVLDPVANGVGGGRQIPVSYPYIGRQRDGTLFTRMAHKDYRPCYQKGRILEGMQTLPFGHRENRRRRRRATSPLPPPTPPPGPVPGTSTHTSTSNHTTVPAPGPVPVPEPVPVPAPGPVPVPAPVPAPESVTVPVTANLAGFENVAGSSHWQRQDYERGIWMGHRDMFDDSDDDDDDF